MRAIIIIFSFLSFVQKSLGQLNYVNYYNESRSIRNMLQNEDYEGAYKRFKLSLENYDYIFAEDLRMFSAICINLEKCDEGLEFYHKAVKQGFNYKDDYLEFYKNKCKDFNLEFENRLSISSHIYESGLNISYRDTILKYYQLDQQVRRRYNNNLSSDNELRSADSIVIGKILPFVEKFGIADERIIGKEAADNLFIILLHYDEDKANNLGPYLLDALMSGKMKPENYAWIVDRRRVWGNKLKPYYYQLAYGFDKLTEKEIEEINRRRYVIGCRPLSEYTIRNENDGTLFMQEK